MPLHPKPGPDVPFVVGVVERFGKYVLGTEAGNAEITVVRELREPNTKIGLALKKAPLKWRCTMRIGEIVRVGERVVPR
jgi:hypothetical protein